jgi:hypothetical protein
MSKPTWLWFVAFIAFNQFQAGFTRWCLAEQILFKLGLKSCLSCAGREHGHAHQDSLA